MVDGQLHYAVSLEMYTVDCCSCKGTYGITNDAQKEYRRTNDWFYCPYCGKNQHYIEESREKKLERQLERERAHLLRERAFHDQTRADRDAIDRSRSAISGALTKKKKQLDRVKNGVCPCCNRHFKNLHKHMQTKHKSFCADRNVRAI